MFVWQITQINNYKESITVIITNDIINQTKDIITIISVVCKG
jgi:hypothetical protein